MTQPLKKCSFIALMLLIIGLSPTVFSSVPCGDVDGTPGLDISDLVYTIDYAFNDGPLPLPDVCAADVDGTPGFDISDLVYLIDYMFNDGNPLPGSCCPECLTNSDCSIPNAFSTCQANSCVINNCNYGWANCDGDDGNGCETHLKNGVNCASPDLELPPMSGDGNDPNNFSYSNKGEMDFRILFNETIPDFLLAYDLNVHFSLTPPASTNYDLYIYDDNCNLIASSTTTNLVDYVDIHWNDNLGSDDSRYFRVQVKFNSGESCNDWQLQIQTYSTSSNPVSDQKDGDSQ